MSRDQQRLLTWTQLEEDRIPAGEDTDLPLLSNCPECALCHNCGVGPETGPPLQIQREGDWKNGKSSFFACLGSILMSSTENSPKKKKNSIFWNIILYNVWQWLESLISHKKLKNQFSGNLIVQKTISVFLLAFFSISKNADARQNSSKPINFLSHKPIRFQAIGSARGNQTNIELWGIKVFEMTANFPKRLLKRHYACAKKHDSGVTDVHSICIIVFENKKNVSEYHSKSKQEIKLRNGVFNRRHLRWEARYEIVILGLFDAVF